MSAIEFDCEVCGNHVKGIADMNYPSDAPNICGICAYRLVMEPDPERFMELWQSMGLLNLERKST